MKAILISIQPKWVAKILNGEKTIEIRKRFPKDYRGWVYIYCTKNGDILRVSSSLSKMPHSRCDGKSMIRFELDYPVCNGKVIARFYCDNVDKWDIWQDDLEEKLKLACLSVLEFDKYSKGQVAYAIHISQLEIFDKPKDLWEFMSLKSYAQYERDLNQAYEDDEETMSRIYEGIANEDECANCVELTEMSKGYYGLTKAPQSWQFIEVEE